MEHMSAPKVSIARKSEPEKGSVYQSCRGGCPLLCVPKLRVVAQHFHHESGPRDANFRNVQAEVETGLAESGSGQG